VKPDGTGFEKLFDFEDVSTGGMPIGALFLDGETLFGMTTQGGTSNAGTLYRIDADGTDFTKLLDFDITNNGGFPTGGLTSDGTFLYGMTAGGGSNSAGTIFKILPNGTGYTKLYDFDYSSGGTPEGTLLLDGTIMYGLASSGGDFGQGVIFSILTDGDDYNPMHEFDYTPDGAQPRGSLVADANFLYGVTYAGGSNDAGTIFKIKKDGNSFQVLKHLENGPGTGAHPTGSLARDNNYLYGLTPSRGVDEKGTLFRIKFDGTGFDKMLDFNDGSNGSARPLTDGITLWATTYSGGKFNHGTMFRRSLADYVSITKFSPTQGAVGTYVKILGNDFDPVAANNTVQFDGITATVVSASIGEIVAIVPDGASDGPITVTAGGTDTSITDFMVIPEAVMFDGTVKTCNAVFIFDGAPDDLTETFVPGVAGGKIKVTFTSMDIDDELWIYDGPDDSSPKVAELGSGDNSFEYVSTAPGGELTFRYIWQDASSTWEADIECVGAGVIIITNQPDDMEICGNTAVSFTTAATGANNIKYQWQFFDGTDWVDLANDTHYSNVKTASLAVNTTGNFGAGIYRCRVNADGATEVITNEANLVVDPAPDPPTGLGTIDPTCGPFVFDLSVTGGTDGQYRWYTVETGGTPISGAVNSTFTTPSLTATTTYYVANFNGTCESTRLSVSATIKPCTAPVIATANGAAPINGVATIDIASLITDAENDIDVSTLKIIVQPASGAVAVFAGTTLTIDYAGTDFTGTDVLTIEVCDIEGLCATRQVEITIATEIIVYNAVSPNGDGKNDSWVLEYIDLLPSTRSNRVKIYNRWGDEVFEVSDYNNNDRVFNGVNKNGNKLPSGTYFYKISFTGQNGPPDLTGYLQLKY
jgi:gliding motility-associated-like protein